MAIQMLEPQRGNQATGIMRRGEVFPVSGKLFLIFICVNSNIEY